MIRLLLACAIATAVSLVATRALMRMLTARRLHQPIQADGVPSHVEHKQGTPTLGGIGVVMGLVSAYLVSSVFDWAVTRQGLLIVGLIVACCGIGLLDDWDKVSTGSNAGLSASAKFRLQLAAASAFAIAAVWLTDVDTSIGLPANGWSIEIGSVGWVLWAVFTIVAMANGTNLTDGLDGLAAGSMIISFGALATIGFWVFANPDVYGLGHALDVSVLAAGCVGALAGFLWWNAPPAMIIMGDTGSLPLGAALAAIALVLNIDVLLPIVGALYLFETLSVIIQVGVFKRTGRRVFRMAPIHHHFELVGWPETRIVIRFLLFSAGAAAIAVALFYADYVATTPT